MAASLKDISAFMLAAMQSLDIAVPQDVAEKIELAPLEDAMYNEEKVIDFGVSDSPQMNVLNSYAINFSHP